MNINPKTGKALDLSGALSFGAAAIALAFAGNVVCAFAALVAVGGCACSYMAWRSYDRNPYQRRFDVWRRRSLWLTAIAVILFIVGVSV